MIAVAHMLWHQKPFGMGFSTQRYSCNVQMYFDGWTLHHWIIYAPASSVCIVTQRWLQFSRETDRRRRHHCRLISFLCTLLLCAACDSLSICITIQFLHHLHRFHPFATPARSWFSLIVLLLIVWVSECRCCTFDLVFVFMHTAHFNSTLSLSRDSLAFNMFILLHILEVPLNVCIQLDDTLF